MNAIGIAGYLFTIAITEDIKCILNAVDENSKSKKSRKQIYSQFTEFIDLHATIKQLSFQNGLVNFKIVSFLFWFFGFLEFCPISPNYTNQFLQFCSYVDFWHYVVHF